MSASRVGLVDDDLEQLLRACVSSRSRSSRAQRQRRAVDRSQRRAQLVRHGRDEVLAHLPRARAPRSGRGTRRPFRRRSRPPRSRASARRRRARAERLVAVAGPGAPATGALLRGRASRGSPRRPARPTTSARAELGDRLGRAVPEANDAAARRRGTRRRRPSRAREQPVRAPRPRGRAVRFRSPSRLAVRVPPRAQGRSARSAGRTQPATNEITPSVRSRATSGTPM